jgi:hypothetical protein
MYVELAPAISPESSRAHQHELESDELTQLATSLHDLGLVHYLTQKDFDAYPATTPAVVAPLSRFDLLRRDERENLRTMCHVVADAFAEKINDFKTHYPGTLFGAEKPFDYIAGNSNYFTPWVADRTGISPLEINPRIHSLSGELVGYSIPVSDARGNVIFLSSVMRDRQFSVLKQCLENPRYGGGDMELSAAGVLVDMEEDNPRRPTTAGVIGLASMTRILAEQGRITDENVHFVHLYYDYLVKHEIIPRVPETLERAAS